MLASQGDSIPQFSRPIFGHPQLKNYQSDVNFTDLSIVRAAGIWRLADIEAGRLFWQHAPPPVVPFFSC